jgi:hypothetical protein
MLSTGLTEALYEQFATFIEPFVKRIARQQAKYTKEFMNLRCAPDLLAAEVFPRSSRLKEISESFGAYNAVRTYLQPEWALNDRSITVVAVGNGCSPRTAATFAYRTAWNCWSVDPRMLAVSPHKPCLSSYRHPRIDRLWISPTTIEDAAIKCDPTDRVLVVAVHSHADLPAAVELFLDAQEVAVIAIPCCIEQRLKRLPDIEYIDDGILSPKNLVKVWKQVRREDV